MAATARWALIFSFVVVNWKSLQTRPSQVRIIQLAAFAQYAVWLRPTKTGRIRGRHVPQSAGKRHGGISGA